MHDQLNDYFNKILQNISADLEKALADLEKALAHNIAC